MKIIILERAIKELKDLPKIDQLAIGKKIRSLVSELPFEKKLKGFKDVYRVRVGDYRIVYKKTKSKIFIILIGHRKNIYNLLKRLL